MLFFNEHRSELSLFNIGSKFKMTEEIYYHKISFVCVLLETQKRNEGDTADL